MIRSLVSLLCAGLITAPLSAAVNVTYLEYGKGAPFYFTNDPSIYILGYALDSGIGFETGYRIINEDGNKSVNIPSYYVAGISLNAESILFREATTWNGDIVKGSVDWEAETINTGPSFLSPEYLPIEFSPNGDYTVGYISSTFRTPFVDHNGTALPIPTIPERNLYATDLTTVGGLTVYGTEFLYAPSIQQSIWTWKEGDAELSWQQILPNPNYDLQGFEVSPDGSMIMGFYRDDAPTPVTRAFWWTEAEGFHPINLTPKNYTVDIAGSNQVAVIGGYIWSRTGGAQTLDEAVFNWRTLAGLEADVGASPEAISISFDGTRIGGYANLAEGYPTDAEEPLDDGFLLEGYAAPSLASITIDTWPLNAGIAYGFGSYALGSEVSVTAEASPGYVFDQWSSPYQDEAQSFTLTVNMSEGLVANFTPDTADDDNDGLTNYQEIVELGTNPNDPDTDGDGFTDDIEAAYDILNPTVADTEIFALVEANVLNLGCTEDALANARAEGRQQVFDNPTAYNLYTEQMLEEATLEVDLVVKQEGGNATLLLTPERLNGTTGEWEALAAPFEYAVPVSNDAQLLRVTVEKPAEE
ncbi:MAG: hypothetical protein Q7P63_00765 [Verrucomicrobiota bacterium JB022]|nr:hypothetical protein [Verrucomicrobiota bacterium JB022]